MKFVVVLKTQKDVGPSDKYPPSWPLACQEYECESYEDAMKAFPGCNVMPVEQWYVYKNALNTVHGEMVMQKPNWFKRLFGVK